MTDREVKAYGYGQLDYNNSMVPDPSRHDLATQDEREAYSRGYYMAVGADAPQHHG